MTRRILFFATAGLALGAASGAPARWIAAPAGSLKRASSVAARAPRRAKARAAPRRARGARRSSAPVVGAIGPSEERLEIYGEECVITVADTA